MLKKKFSIIYNFASDTSSVKIHIIRLRRPKIGRHTIKISSKTKVEKDGNQKTISAKFRTEGNPVTDCENFSFKEHRTSIYDAVSAMLKEANTIYTVAQCKKILQRLPSSLLRREDAYEEYQNLIEKVVDREFEKKMNGKRVNLTKINDKRNKKLEKYTKKYFTKRDNALKSYVSEYKSTYLVTKDPLSDFERNGFSGSAMTR